MLQEWPQEGTPDAAQLFGCGFYLNLSEEMTPSESSGSKCQAEKTPARRCMDTVKVHGYSQFTHSVFQILRAKPS